ncbi:MAG TPA: hypothetical protein DGH68_08390, partial [Bacteroidetes bacterium]|nr:hypothetical protein [Bacteroidota bacterium]
MVCPYRLLITIFCIAFSFLGIGCKDNGADPETLPKYLIGQVQDEQGNKIPDVDVHYLFDVNPSSGLHALDNILVTITIHYEVLHPAHVNLKVLRWYTEELIITLIDTEQNAGNYSVSFDAAQMTNGVYFYRLWVGTSVTERRMLLLNTDLPALTSTRPLATSDAQGQFTIANEQFGLGIPFFQTTVPGNVPDTVYVSPAVQIVLHKDGFQTLVQPILIDPFKETRA